MVIDISIYNKIGIYGIKNKINNNVYVGKTQMNFGDRWDSHRALLRENKHFNNHLQNAWNKYGESNFEFEILYEATINDDLDVLEKEYIAKYKNDGISYNISDGGDGGTNLGKHLSKETKNKIGNKNRKHMLGKKMSKATKKKMSLSQKERCSNMTLQEKEEYSKNISEYASGYQWSEESKNNFSKIQQIYPNGAKYDIKTVKLIRYLHEKKNMTYTEISKSLDIKRPTVYLIATYRRWKNV